MSLLKPTLHVEVSVKAGMVDRANVVQLRNDVKQWLTADFVTVQIGHDFSAELSDSRLANLIEGIEVVDYTGPPTVDGDCYHVRGIALDVQTYTLKAENERDPRRSISQADDSELAQARVLQLPSIALKDEWNSLVFDDALPARLLRYMTRMVGMMKQPGLNLSTFNWNRLCLLHGPPGSGKSTLCRALAQQLSIRLGDSFPNATLIEINTNAMLSKYFGESGKLIGATFEKITAMAQDQRALICVVMDEVETIAGSRERSTSGAECNDGMRATNQLLTALDRLRHLPNVIVLCTSNLIGAIDQAFLDRVDIKQLIPSPSPAAIYNIFRSCLNELVRSSLVDAAAMQVSSCTTTARRVVSRSTSTGSSSPAKPIKRSKTLASSSSPEPWTVISAPEIPTYSEMLVRWVNQPQSPGRRVWALAQKCEGFSGRTLRRLPILGLAMYTWGGDCSLDDAITALEAAVNQELLAKGTAHVEVKVEVE
ncbi:hypothetical protein LTR36_007881 [Oleoguttula mirabilis]|uniref:AAA+ ATPase domain-containing protein n=1 Tax=Oleoguttula mirabilis TaxID=1507867 RepID=A0AAV9J9X6_9PEZI|nr:hypothetical protein LTR36_007881 [Oleoguttula mirabilis]